jgi:hypothetical protein
LENARRENWERERLKQSLAAVRLTGLDETGAAADGYPASCDDAESFSLLAGPGKEALARWQAALSELELQMTKATFNTWLRPARLLAWESSGDGNGNATTRIVLGTPNEYIKDWLENRLHIPIRRTLSGIAGNAVEVEFEVCDQFHEQDLPILNAR